MSKGFKPRRSPHVAPQVRDTIPGLRRFLLPMLYPSSYGGDMEIKPRPCLVCERPCLTEGQLCVECAAAGHRVTDTEVIVQIGVDWP